jgi:prepilin-type N-terminal cleavage/methylation domain-containing protein
MELKRNKIRNTQYAIRNTRYAFTLVELLIVVAILGILAAMILPTLQGHIQQAKESAAKDDLRILRNAIGLYAAQHNDIPPGYFNDDTSKPPLYAFMAYQLATAGHYLSEFPKNPFNNKHITKVIGDNTDFPAEPVETSEYGWIYKPATKTIRLNWEGTDSAGVAYFDY